MPLLRRSRRGNTAESPPAPAPAGEPGQPGQRGDELEEASAALAPILEGQADASSMRRLGGALGRSARQAGARGVASGQWAAEVLVDLAARMAVRDQATLRLHHGGKEGNELAAELIRAASRASAAVGAAAGAVASATHLLPPAWPVLPVELAVETTAVVAIEVKLVAELHEAYGRPVPGSGMGRGLVLVRLWAERRGVTLTSLASSGGRIEGPMTDAARAEVLRLARRQIVRRLTRNTVSWLPLLVGAAAGAETNRRATRLLGQAVARSIVGSMWQDWEAWRQWQERHGGGAPLPPGR